MEKELKLGVISDTHARSFSELPQNLLKALTGVDLIVHAGDIVAMDVIRGLESIAPVSGVYGNMDYPEVRVEFPQQRVIEINGRKIGLVHGNGGPGEIRERVRRLFPVVDVIVYGHSHGAVNEIYKGALLFNPGSTRESFGILNIGDKVEGTIYRNYL